MEVFQTIIDQKIIAIIRGFGTEDSLKITKALSDGGIDIIEVTLNSENAYQTLEKISTEMGDKVLLGAGTVLDSESCQAAIYAGARFIISPSLNIETIKTARRYGALCIPGAMTPTEILTAYEEGADFVKVFPANLFGPGYIKDLRGPLSQLKLLPSGGIDLDNIQDYLAAGAMGVGLGGSLVSSTKVVNEVYLQDLTEKAQKFVQKVEEFKQKN